MPPASFDSQINYRKEKKKKIHFKEKKSFVYLVLGTKSANVKKIF